MNDFTTILLALGRGFIKILISALVGVGVGLLSAGISMSNRPVMNGHSRDAQILIGVGAGVLSGAAMLLILFLVPWVLERAPQRHYEDALVPVERGTRERNVEDDRPASRPPPAPHGEPGAAGYYSK